MRGGKSELLNFLDWFKGQPATHKIMISGNHDFFCQMHSLEVIKETEARGIVYLQDNGCELDGIKFYGSPWQPWFHNWAWNFSRNPDKYKSQAEKIWNLIPADTQVLITHGPPYGIQDRVDRPTRGENPNVGCKYLLDRIQVVKPLVHISGHIHESYGEQLINGTVFWNASCQDVSYSGARNPPRVIDLDTLSLVLTAEPEPNETLTSKGEE